jgi:Cd2+/Zn2+-exporting ATPase
MTDELSSIPRAIKIARHTNKIVWENIIFALGIKVVIMLLATIGFANMWMAIFADVGVAVIAILNSIRALKVKKL